MQRFQNTAMVRQRRAGADGPSWSRTTLTAAIALLALVLAACGGDDDGTGDTDGDDVGEVTEEPDAEPDDETDAEPEAEPEADGELTTVVIGLDDELTTLDLGQQSGWHETYPLDNIYDSLTRRAEDGSTEPWLARDWETSDDGMHWTLYLEEGVLFHNGEEMTAEDVKYSIDRYIDDEWPGQLSTVYENVDNVEIIDDYTVQVNLLAPTPLFMHNTPFRSAIVPKSLAETMEFAEYGQSPEVAVGSGPYQVVEWTRDDRLVLEAFEDYWAGPPAIDELVFRPIIDTSARTAALRAGEIHIAVAFPVEQIDTLEGTGATAKSAQGTARQRLILNANREPFDQVEVRQAVNYALNVPDITENVMLGFGEPMAMFGLPSEVGFSPDLEPYPYDPDRARELLEEAGYPDGVEVDFHVRSGYIKAEEVAQAIAAQLADVGIDTNVTVMPSPDFARLSEEKDITLGFTGHGGASTFHVEFGLTSVFHCERGSGVHAGFYCNDEIADLLDEALDLLDAGEEEAAISNYQEVERICLEQACQGNLYGVPHIYGVNDELSWEPHPSGELWMYRASF